MFNIILKLSKKKKKKKKKKKILINKYSFIVFKNYFMYFINSFF